MRLVGLRHEYRELGSWSEDAAPRSSKGLVRDQTDTAIATADTESLSTRSTTKHETATFVLHLEPSWSRPEAVLEHLNSSRML